MHIGADIDICYATCVCLQGCFNVKGTLVSQSNETIVVSTAEHHSRRYHFHAHCTVANKYLIAHNERKSTDTHRRKSYLFQQPARSEVDHIQMCASSHDNSVSITFMGKYYALQIIQAVVPVCEEINVRSGASKTRKS
jgi:hypothetical protein